MDVKGYAALDKNCPKRHCWSPGLFQHRGACMGGSRNSGSYTKCCMTRAYRGCPDPIPEPSKHLPEVE